MAKRTRKNIWSNSINRIVSAMTRTAIRTGSKAIKKVLRAKPAVRKSKSAKTDTKASVHWSAGVAMSVAGARRYWLFKPPGIQTTERLPLMVMLHGCGQDANALAASTRMNRIAVSKRFLVLYPEQERISNPQACWNWYGTRTGQAQREADSIIAAIDQVCQSQSVDPCRIVLAGLSAGASMAALLATRHPQRFRVIAMHSGIAPGIAYSSSSAFMAMRGRKMELVPLSSGIHFPALLVIHGSSDHIVAPNNGADAALLWAAQEGAQASTPRTVQRGTRYAVTITDYRIKGRLIASHCQVNGLGHAWSGGAPGFAYSDPKGPDASRMIWAFADKQFTSDGK